MQLSASEKATNLASERMRAHRLARAALFAALTAVGAALAIPLPISAVPFTLQVLFTLTAGLLLGARFGAYSQAAYVVMGALGLPVFNRGTAGLGVLLGPTGGYLAGFVVGAWVAGLVAELIRRSLPSHCALRLAGYTIAAVVGVAVIHGLGVWRLAAVLQVSFAQAAVVGSLPFVVPDAVKAVAAAALVVQLERRGLSGQDEQEAKV